MGLACSSYVGSYSDAKVSGERELAAGTEVTTRPGNALLIVRRLPGLEMLYDNLAVVAGISPIML